MDKELTDLLQKQRDRPEWMYVEDQDGNMIGEGLQREGYKGYKVLVNPFVPSGQTYNIGEFFVISARIVEAHKFIDELEVTPCNVGNADTTSSVGDATSQDSK